jgi:hypothetical protein
VDNLVTVADHEAIHVVKLLDSAAHGLPESNCRCEIIDVEDGNESHRLAPTMSEAHLA